MGSPSNKKSFHSHMHGCGYDVRPTKQTKSATEQAHALLWPTTASRNRPLHSVPCSKSDLPNTSNRELSPVVTVQASIVQSRMDHAELQQTLQRVTPNHARPDLQRTKDEGQRLRARFSFEDFPRVDTIAVRKLKGNVELAYSLSPARSESDRLHDTVASQSFNLTSSNFSPTAPRVQREIPRYYSHALSDEDKAALSIGELNHNHKIWTEDDVKEFQRTRKEVLLYTNSGDESSWLGETRLRVTSAVEGVHKEPDGFRALRNRGTFTSIRSRPTSAASYFPRPLVSIDEALDKQVCPASNSSSTTVGSHYDISRTRHLSIETDFSSRPSRPVSQLTSFLSEGQQPYMVRPRVTFDSFLTSHVSGKGEAFQGSENAVKDGIEVENNAKKIKEKRLSKMPSISAPCIFKLRNGGPNSS